MKCSEIYNFYFFSKDNNFSRNDIDFSRNDIHFTEIYVLLLYFLECHKTIIMKKRYYEYQKYDN